jgi:hypothetical protein
VHEIILPHRKDAMPVSYVRSTLLQSSLATLRRLELIDKWRRLIAPEIGRELEEAIAPAWIDAELAVAHYRACDGLGLGAQEIDAIGQQVGDHLQNVLVAFGARAARTAGLDVRHAVMAFEKLFSRVFQGGSLSVIQTGPKDVLVELKGMRLTCSFYFRTAYMGHLKAATKFVGVRACYVKSARVDSLSDTFIVAVSWV